MWDEQFKPLQDALGLSVRDEQTALANEIIRVMDSDVGVNHLVSEAGTGTGKSFAYLVPLVHKVKGTDRRGVISTETLTLQDQVAYKDLPLLQKVYGGFTFMTLKGRSNYLCIARANVEAHSNPDVYRFLSLIEKKRGQFSDGFRDELNQVIGETIPDDVWRSLCGESEFCSDCNADDGNCYGTIARKKAPSHDIIVTNHALLHADGESDSGILGEHQYVIVDEAHTLEDVFISSLQDDISSWEVFKHKKAINEGAKAASNIIQEYALEATAEYLTKSLDNIINTVIDFYSEYTDGPWDKAEGVIRERFVMAQPGTALHTAMVKIEEEMPEEIERAKATIRSMTQAIVEARTTLRESSGKKSGVRKLSKAITSLGVLRRVLDMLANSVSSKDGIVNHYGVPYVVEFSGKLDKTNTKRLDLSFVPIDVSEAISNSLWQYDKETQTAKKTCIMVSATLTDITDGSFRYARTSVGFPGAGVSELVVNSPFNYDEQQLVYTTPGNYDIVPVERAQYSLDEAVDLVKAARGRSLLLFTAKAEMEYAAEAFRGLGLPYNILVQGEGMTKNELADAFMADPSSVLIATKSFFTGVNFSGEACSMVIMCKFPLKRFTGVCQAQMAWWRGRGFPNWYEMQALTVFSQAAGRLIRSETDRGVVAIIDKRVSAPKERVYKTASMGISTLGSIVTNNMDDVKEFFQ